MYIKNITFKLALTASVIALSFSANAQSIYDTSPVEGLEVISQDSFGQQIVTAPEMRANPNLPASMQHATRAQAPVQPTAPTLDEPQYAEPIGAFQNSESAQDIGDQFVKSFNAPNPYNVTMEELLTHAYINNPELAASREAVKAVDEGVSQALSGYLPSLSYNIARDKSKETINSGAANDIYPKSDTLNLRQGIFAGGRTYYSVESAENRVLSARQELRKVEQDFLFDAITAYVDYIFTQKVLKLAENNEVVLEEQMRATRDRFVVGDATKTDVAQSEARLANANSNKVIANGEFVNAKANFRRIFGKEVAGSLPMPSNLPDVPPTLEDALKVAFNNNPELKQLEYIVQSRDNDIDVQRSALLPQVDLNGSTGERQTSNNFGGLTRSENETVGVNVSVPIYDKGTAYSRMREATDRRNQSNQQLANTKNAVRSAVIQSWQRLSTTATNIEATKASLVASEFALDGAREEQKEGARTVIEVLNAEQERFSAETAHARAIKDGLLAVYALKATLGELTPEQLKLSVPTYNSEEHYKNTRFKFIGL